MSEEDKKYSHLSLVAEGDPEKMRRDFARAAAEDQLSWAIRELASNLMRILAGGGKSHELIPQINAFIEAYAACEEAAASRNGITLEQALRKAAESPSERYYHDPDAVRRASEEELHRWYDSGSSHIEGGKDDVMQAALRVMASRIVGQTTQERTAEHAIFEGIRRIKEGQEQSAKYHSSPKYVAQLKLERERRRAEQLKRMESAQERDRQQAAEREHARAERVAQREQQRIERMQQRERPAGKIAPRAAGGPLRKIGMFDALDAQRAGKPPEKPD